MCAWTCTWALPGPVCVCVCLKLISVCICLCDSVEGWLNYPKWFSFCEKRQCVSRQRVWVCMNFTSGTERLHTTLSLNSCLRLAWWPVYTPYPVCECVRVCVASCLCVVSPFCLIVCPCSAGRSPESDRAAPETWLDISDDEWEQTGVNRNQHGCICKTDEVFCETHCAPKGDDARQTARTQINGWKQLIISRMGIDLRQGSIQSVVQQIVCLCSGEHYFLPTSRLPLTLYDLTVWLYEGQTIRGIRLFLSIWLGSVNTRMTE